MDQADISKLAAPFNYRQKRSNIPEWNLDEAWENKKRDARRDRVYLWINRIVPYEIDSSLSMLTTSSLFAFFVNKLFSKCFFCSCLKMYIYK